MVQPTDIKHVPNAGIDKVKWDRCIDNASNGLIYAYSYYLDHMSRQWDGLVLGDYEYVMPLTWNRKYGIAYLYQPFLAAQLGIFGKNPDAGITEAFLLAIPSKFRYWDIYLNFGNLFTLERFRPYVRRNFVLDLSPDYQTLHSKYRENIQRNVRKAFQLGCTIVKDFEVQQVVELAISQMVNHTKDVKENVERFTRLFSVLAGMNKAVTYGVHSSTGQLIASCIFIFSHNRAYYILVGNHPDGRTIGASHALIDAFIKDHAGSSMILDFEGSDIRNLAFFYSSFGAVEENYPGLKVNKLPAYLKWLKP